MSDKQNFWKKQSEQFTLIFSVNLLVLLSILSVAKAQPVNIPDPGLRVAVEEALAKKPGDIITESEMSDDDFTFLFGNDMDIRDLTGLEYATNLQTVYLDDNTISALTPLSNLTRLEHLHLANNQISDISPLSNITALQSIHLEHNNLTSLDGLPDLSSVYALHFDFNQIINIESLVNHTELTGDVYINLEENPLDDTSLNTYIPTLKDRDVNVIFYLKFIKKVSGDHQTSNTNMRLQPFVVEAYDRNDNKLSGNDIRFYILSGSGDFGKGSYVSGDVTFDTKTDADGRASATLTTGSATGTYLVIVLMQGASAETFRVTVTEGPIPSPSLQEQPSQQGPPVDDPDTDIPQQQQELQEQQEPLPQQEEQTPQQQQEPTVDDPDTDIPQQQQEQQEQQEPLPQEEEQTRQQQQEPPSDESDTDIPQQQPSESYPQPAPNYTIFPFDYEREGVGKVVFSELMLAHLGKYPQWIELYNTTDQDIDINGWKIVGRYLNDSNTITILESQVISKSFTIKGQETGLIVSFATSNSRDRISSGLADKAYALQSTLKNFWNYEGLALELQDAEGNPIDRFGNLNVENEIVWEIPLVVREKRISLIRRLKSFRSKEYNFTFGIKEFGWFPTEKVERLINNRSQYYYGRYTDIGAPGYRTKDGETLPVTLSSFRSQLNKNGPIILSWVTESELDNAGFNILRSQCRQGPFVQVNPKLIQGAGTTSKRNEYTWTDTTAKPNIEYYYQIEDVSFAGLRQTLTTTRLKGLISAKNRFTIRWGQLKSRH